VKLVLKIKYPQNLGRAEPRFEYIIQSFQR